MLSNTITRIHTRSTYHPTRVILTTHKSYSLLSYSPVPRTHAHTRTHTTVWVALSVSLVHKWRAKIGRQQRGRIYSNYFDSRIRNRRALIRGRGMK